MIELADARLFLVSGAPFVAAGIAFVLARAPWLWTRIAVVLAGHGVALAVACSIAATIAERGGFGFVDINGWAGARVSGIDPFGLVPAAVTPSTAPLLVVVEAAGLLASLLLVPNALRIKSSAPLVPALLGTAFLALLLVARRLDGICAGFVLASVSGSALLLAFHPQRPDVEGTGRAFLMHRAGDLALLTAVLIVGTALPASMGGPLDLEKLAATAPGIDVWARATSGPLAGYAPREVWMVLGALVVAAASSRLAFAVLLPLVRDAVGAPGAAIGFAHGACFLGGGLILLLRMTPILWLAPEALVALGWLAAVSVVGASLFALAGRDLVRIDVHLLCAASALASVAFAGTELGTALFASVLVVGAAVPLCASTGVVVEATGRTDPHALGGLEPLLPRTHTTRLIVTGALFGPLFSGAAVFAHDAAASLFAPWLGAGPAVVVVAAAPLCAVAAFRPLHLAFTGKAPREPLARPASKEPAAWRTWPAIALALPLVGLFIAHLPAGVLAIVQAIRGAATAVSYRSPADALVVPERAELNLLRAHVLAPYTTPSTSPIVLVVAVVAALSLGFLASRALYAGGPSKLHHALFGGARVQKVVAVLADVAGRESQVAKAAGEGAMRLSRLIATNLAPGVLDTLLRRIPSLVFALLGYVVRFIANGSAQRGLVVALFVLAALAWVLR